MYTQKNKYIAPLTEIHRVKVHAVMAGSIKTPGDDEDPDERGWHGGHDFVDTNIDDNTLPERHNLWED